jgi:hypothetical protein
MSEEAKSVVRIITGADSHKVEQELNTLILQYEKEGYVANLTNLTPVTTQATLVWRFILLFNVPEPPIPLAPPFQ